MHQTVSSFETFFLAMTSFPEVQAKAQVELDTVIGKDRIPTLADKDRLPYISALTLEVLRWHPIAPFGIPHRSTEDDTYQDYFFPAGTVFIPNIMFVPTFSSLK